MNIAVLGGSFEKAILLDLRSFRPLDYKSLTDSPEKRPFVGKTQYSPPEFFVRDEKESPDGYRAVTFYQLGAVLHDMLMRRPTFLPNGHTRKDGRAVLLEEPIIDCTDAPFDLVRLAKCCLVKDPGAGCGSFPGIHFATRILQVILIPP